MSTQLLEKLFSLKGKSALITGGSRGIGRKIAETYAAIGADVAIAARDLAGCEAAAGQISSRYGVKAIAKFMDVNDSAIVDQVVAEVARELGKIDILVNSAGIPGSEKPVLKMSNDDLNNVMNVDFRGIFYVCRAAANEMVKRKKGRIINIASLAAKIAAPNMSGYCASKGAVVQFTRVLALELMRDNIQVNVLCPGYFLTDFNRPFFESEIGQKIVKKSIPLNRVGNLEELQSAAIFLATCPQYMTGAELYIDGAQGIV